MRSDASPVLAVTCLLYWIPPCVCYLAPGSPKITRCRSPEKETFSCWWEPGSTGGLPTTYRLFYRKERSEMVFECPDYHSAGNSSCFFDKTHTSIWIIYNITVIATNAEGSTFSEPVEVDVMDIVHPHAPENVTLTLMGTEENPYFLVKWEAPRGTDTRSGWVTLKYEVRVKLDRGGQEHISEWEVYNCGKQKNLSIYSPQPGGKYTVQVRCKLDQGLWSEWSPSAFIQVPNNLIQEQPVTFLISFGSAFIALVTVGILIATREHVKNCLLPPVPGPKIKGFDSHLQQTDKSEDIFGTLNFQGIIATPDCKEQVEYLVVLNSEEDSETSESKAPQKYQETDHNFSHHEDGVHCCNTASTQRIWNKLNTTQSLQWKRPAVHNCQGSDHESTSLYASLDTFYTQDVNHQQRMVVYQNSQIKSEKDLVRNCRSSCISSMEQNELCPDGFEEYAKEKHRADCKLNPTTQEKEDYSKVSGIYSDIVLVLEKDSSTIDMHKGKNHECPSKEIHGKSIHPDKVGTHSQDYMVTL
ncbi:prolactin receptor b [Trichomycterus rosablanca]|uniref:prolactin receptor b n=1 Tax=Trichomycterus rosablanca TaxID=2290929 RepID=UPI002F350CED